VQGGDSQGMMLVESRKTRRKLEGVWEVALYIDAAALVRTTQVTQYPKFRKLRPYHVFTSSLKDLRLDKNFFVS
jgi:hypothetical protein